MAIREKIHLIRINRVSSAVIDAFRAFNSPEYFDVLVKLNQGCNTSEKVAQDESMSIAHASAILSILKRKGIIKAAKQKDGRYSQYSFNTHMMRKIKTVSKLNW